MPPKEKQGKNALTCLELLSISLTRLYAGVLKKQLDQYLALSNSLGNRKKIQEARSLLISAACKRIEGCNGKLSNKEIKALKNAMNKFVDRRNEVLARRVMQALDESKWGALRIEVRCPNLLKFIAPRLTRLIS